MEAARASELIRLAPDMARNIIHEVDIANSAMDLLINDKTLSPELCEKLSSIKAQVARAAARARQFQIVTQSDSRQSLNPQEQILDLARLLQTVLGEGIQIQIRLEPGLGLIEVAANQFDDVLLILAVNARQAMPNGGALRIRAMNTQHAMGGNDSGDTAPADCVAIEIEDTGIGIPELDIGRIFDPFFTTKGRGCGFGLATVYSVVKNANGQISVSSIVGKGTTFKIVLPRHPPRQPKAAS